MKDILVILMVAFGLFAIVMFVLFYVYLRKYYNKKHLEEDYEKLGDDDTEPELAEPLKKESVNVNTSLNTIDDVYNDGEFVPLKKK